MKTSTPGVYKRGGSYVVMFRDGAGKQRKRAAKTLNEARALKAALTTDVHRGEFRALSPLTFSEYVLDWIRRMARTIWQIRKENHAGSDDLIFTSEKGQQICTSNLMSRILKPAGRKAGAPPGSASTPSATPAPPCSSAEAGTPSKFNTSSATPAPASPSAARCTSSPKTYPTPASSKPRRATEPRKPEAPTANA